MWHVEGNINIFIFYKNVATQQKERKNKVDCGQGSGHMMISSDHMPPTENVDMGNIFVLSERHVTLINWPKIYPMHSTSLTSPSFSLQLSNLYLTVPHVKLLNTLFAPTLSGPHGQTTSFWSSHEALRGLVTILDS